MDPEIVRRILGCLPEPDAEPIARVRTHVEGCGLLLPGERLRAAMDETWLGNARRGVVLTDRRVFRYRDGDATDVVGLAEIERARLRRMWYPPAPLVGRGDVVILRIRFDLRGGGHARLRVQDCAGALRPFVEELLGRIPAFEVARTLPGL